MCLCTAALLLPMTLAGGEALPPSSGSDWGWLLAYAFIAQVCGWLVIGRAMPKLSAGVLGLCLLLQPLMAYVWDAAFFGTRLDAAGLVGLGLVAGGDLPRAHAWRAHRAGVIAHSRAIEHT
jgi:drug/metabolite transporter (DMT)-like permease